MATKNYCSSLKKSTVTDSKSGSRLTNINLTQNRKCQDFYPVKSKSISNKDEKNFNGKNYESLKEKSYGNSSWNKCEKNFKTFDFTSLYNSEKNQNQFQHKLSSTNNSTLSLHISAYESSIEVENDSDEQRKVTLKTFKSDPFNKIKNGIKQNFSSFSLSNPFEFPRQQENQVGGEPEIMQFKSSQKLLTPTDSSSKANSNNKESRMAPKPKEQGLRELTVKLEYEREPRDRVDLETFKSVISAAFIYVLGQTVPSYSIGSFDERSRKGTIIMDAQHLNLLWAALSIYGNHFGQKIAFHYFSIKEEE